MNSRLGDMPALDPAGKRSERLLFVILVTAAAAILRGYHLGASPLWIDEFQTWRNLHPGAGHGLWEQFRDNVQGPLYLLLSWRPGQPDTPEWLLRLPAALAGILAVPLMYKLGSEWRDRSTGAWAALLLALNPFHVWYGQEARGYSLMVLLMMAATWQLLRMQRRGATTRGGLTYGLLAGLAVLGNMSALFLIAAQALGVLLLHRPRDGEARRGWVVAFGVAGLIALPWLLQASGFWYPGRLAPGGGGGLLPEGQERLTPLAVPYALFTFFYGFSFGPTLEELHRPDRLEFVRRYWPLLAAGALAAAFPTLVGWWRSRRRLETALWIVVPFVALIAMRLLDVKTFTPRYLAVTAPIFLLAAGHGLSVLHGWTVRVACVALLGLTIWSSASYHVDPRYAKDDVRSAAVWIANQDAAGEPVLVPVVTDLFRLYYRGRGEVRDFWGLGSLADRDAAVHALSERIGEADQAWLVLSRSGALDPGRHLAPALDDLGDIVAVREFPGVTALRWRRAPAAGGEAGR
jgi:4-amino-4-deoxy-L-arabinose transferase-like glycosyltransferase